jgi:hypothetical protein
LTDVAYAPVGQDVPELPSEHTSVGGGTGQSIGAWYWTLVQVGFQVRHLGTSVVP